MLVSEDMRMAEITRIGLALSAMVYGALGQPLPNTGQAKGSASLGIAWGFLYGYFGTKAETFMPLVRGMGGVGRFRKSIELAG